MIVFQKKCRGILPFALLTAGLLCLNSCRSSETPETVMKPVVRLMPAASSTDQPRGTRENPTTVHLPTTTLDDTHDTRYVLQPLQRSLLLLGKTFTVGDNGKVTFQPSLPEQWETVERVVIRPQLQREQKWTQLPEQTVAVRPLPHQRAVPIELVAEGASPGETVELYVEAFAIEKSLERTTTSDPVTVPPGARLSFALAIPRIAWEQGAVTFEIDACRRDNCQSIFAETVDPSREEQRGWLDRDVALDKLSGQQTSFRFKTRVQKPGPGAYSFVQWGNPTIFARTPRPSSARNVILLSIDTLRADHLSSYDYQHDTAPFIAETFGKKGVIFDHCVAASVITSPAHMTMFTGVQPCVHLLKTGAEVLPNYILTMTEYLRANDIETGAVTEDGWLAHHHGFGRGFNTYVENVSPDIMVPLGQIDVTFARAKDWLRRNRDKQFFLFLHTYQVHDPYSPPDEYKHLFGSHDGTPITAESPRHLREMADYDREIRYTDDQLRDLFATLHDLKLDRNTVFILTSDHGEEFFEHGCWGHGTDLYEETTRVPLMFWGAGVPQGRRVETPVGQIDFMATILDLFGLPPSPQSEGRSLVGMLRGEASDSPVIPIFSEAWGSFRVGPNYDMQPFDRPSYLVQSGLHKLIRTRDGDGFAFESYDLASDPLEKQNRYSEADPEITRLRKLLDGYENRCKVSSLALQSSTVGQNFHPPGTAHIGPAEEEKLRALGYLK